VMWMWYKVVAVVADGIAVCLVMIGAVLDFVQ